MTAPANPLLVAFTDRSGTAWLLPDGVSLTVDYLSRHRLLGYKRATITAKGPRPAVFELLETIRYGVKIYSATDPAVWLGLVEGVNVYDGENRVGLSLRDMANRVAVAYSYVEPGTSTVGVRKTTAWADDTASQNEFGVKEYLHSSDGTTDAGAVQLRDTFLADHALPVAARTYAGGLGMEAGEITASIECIGWIMTLGWEYYADSSTTNTATSTQISNILSAAQFINSVAVSTASGISTSRYRKGDETMLTELLALMEMGTTNGKTYQLAIDEARNVRVFETPADTTVSYRQRVDGQVLSTFDEPIDGYRVEAGTWIELKDALPGSVDTTWMRYIGKFLIEEVEWTASRPDKPRLTPAGTRGGGVSLVGGGGSGLTIPRIQAAIVGEWTDYDATMSGTGGSAGTYAEGANGVARYCVIGNICHLLIRKQIANKGSWTGNVRMALPVLPANIPFVLYGPPCVWAQYTAPNAPKAFPRFVSYEAVLTFEDAIFASLWDWSEVVVGDTILLMTSYEI
jgi:hypothetical protein